MRPAGNANLKIRDLSHHDGVVDYARLKAQGFDGVLIKATEGGDYTDPMCAAHAKGAQLAGLRIGFYHFFSFVTDVNTQVKNFLAQIAPYQADYKPALDIEQDAANNAVIPADLMQRAAAFLSAVGVQYPPMVYANPDLIRTHFSTALSAYPLWIAHYHVAEPADVPCFTAWTGWQYQAGPDESLFTAGILLSASASGKGGSGAPAKGEPAVLAVQQKLNKIGLPRPPLAEDGILGEKTRGAIVTFQTVCGIAADGIYGPQSDSAYRQIIAKPTLQKSATGIPVRFVQYRLGIAFDGIFGSQTDACAKAFQRTNALTADGIVGPLTWRAFGC